MYHSIRTINADVAHEEFGALGQGIVWAVIGSGVDSSLPHFATYANLILPDGLGHLDIRRKARRARKNEAQRPQLEERKVKVPRDPSGFGTSLAAVIAGESRADGEILRGMAPQCKIISINVLDPKGAASEFEVIGALSAIHTMNGDGTNLRVHGVLLAMEVGWDQANYACGYSPVCVELDRLVNSGVVVVVGAGNRGFDQDARRAVEGSITDPGNAPNAITVGATHRRRPREYGPSFFSARGPTADGRLKPDLLAPGEWIDTWCVGALAGGGEPAVLPRDGTSYAAAHVAGAAAALLSVQRDLIGCPHDVKELLIRTAADLGRERVYQGAGLIDLAAALRSARQASAKGKPAVQRPALKVFCSYAREDQPLWIEFETHLSSMQSAGLIEVWSDRAIQPGKQWEPAILEQLEAADIVILLVSSFFTKSTYCWSTEMPRALERQTSGSARVVPVLVRPVGLADTPLSALQVVPPNLRAVTSFSDPHEGWMLAAETVREVAMEIRAK